MPADLQIYQFRIERKLEMSFYTGIVVDMCTASAVSATRIRRKICGPWLDDGPKEDESIEVVSVDPYVPGVDAPMFWLGR
jgi:hypothetical protein